MATAPAIGRAVPASVDAAAELTRDLYERFSRQIFAYCLVQLRNREEAEDAVQSTFLNAFRGLERGIVPELESAWLYKIAQHVCLTRQRAWSRRRVVESPQDLDAVSELLSAPVRDADAIASLTDALRELPEPQRRAILLREWQGLSYREIADEMQVSQAAVETLIFRARRALAQGREKLRSLGDLGSVAAALKSLLLGGGTKVAATLVTVATTSVVAATPAARHGVVHIVGAVTHTRAAPKALPHRSHHAPPKIDVTLLPPAVHAPPAVRHPVRHRPKPAHARPAPRVAPSTVKTVRLPPPAAPVVEATPAPKPATKPHTAVSPVEATTTTTTAATPAPPPADGTPAVTAAAKTAPAPAATGDSDKSRPAASPAATPAPASVGGFSPSSGAAGTIVQLSGKGFTGATSVRFNGTSADFKVVSDSQITTKVPLVAASGTISVVTPAGTVTTDASFTVTAGGDASTTAAPAAPAISGISPASGSPGQSVGIGGKFLTGATAVRFNGTSADYTVVSDTLITTRVPAGATTGPLTVVTANGTTTSTATFTVTTVAPTVTGLSPASGPPGTIVQIGGTHLNGATAVRFNDASADFTVVSETQITAKVPAGAASGPITVFTPQGSASGGTFTVTSPAPVVESFTPGSGAPGAYVSLSGRNFTGTTSVKFDGVAASFSVTSDTQLYAAVPAGATTGPIAVTTPNGTTTTATAFTVTAAAPEITGMSPGSGAPGSSVSIGGHGFTGATSVKFNGVAASFTVNSDSLITAVVPAGATSGPVSVTTPNGTATSTGSFTVTH